MKKSKKVKQPAVYFVEFGTVCKGRILSERSDGIYKLETAFGLLFYRHKSETYATYIEAEAAINRKEQKNDARRDN